VKSLRKRGESSTQDKTIPAHEITRGKSGRISRSDQFLKKKVEWTKNAPLLSDILTCPEEYRVAIENYLEPYLNYYIVNHEAEAYDAINILSDASKGKANFFILDAFEKFIPIRSASIRTLTLLHRS